MPFDLNQLRAQFPILSRQVNNKPLVYLDSAASTQRPEYVIDAESHFYRYQYAAVHRGVHTLSAEATEQMEQIRQQVATFINAAAAEEIVFVRGTTEGINLVANSWAESQLTRGDNLIITEMEHHANIVPWQLVAKRMGLQIRVLPLTPQGVLDIDRLPSLIDSRTRLLAVTAISNVLGNVNPLKQLIAMAKRAGVVSLVDGAQAITHCTVDVQDLDCDFYVFSGHKMYAPTGIGVLYGRKACLEQMPPWQGGGAMIDQVCLPEGTTWGDIPWRFEAGTPNVGAIIGLGAAIRWMQQQGMAALHQHEAQLMRYAEQRLMEVDSLTLYGPSKRTGVIAFNLGNHHAFDVGSFLDQYGIAIRTGHHCAMPLMHFFNVPAMCRASFACYNNQQEIDHLVAGLTRVQKLLSR